ncbi:MAG: prepilin-type N-terminal cleavage/methylation domain-containing protein, partial [Planctomycetes bacterium]|nr:prepilin-type N-terminal cleavage/methylation domain-containing protein [Planctomycetota bacterium]
MDHHPQLKGASMSRLDIVTRMGCPSGRSSQSAFTLIELMISIALSAVILLVAVSAFRQASQTMALMNRLSIENGMLRTGYLLSVNDCDYWNSLANPDYPYLKGYMSDAVPVLGGNSAANKRAFKEVHFSKGSPLPVPATGITNFDPNWDLPHDARSWYRNFLLPSYRSYRPILSEPDATGSYLYAPYFGDSARDTNGGVCEVWLDGFGRQVFSSYCVASPGWAIGGHNSGQLPVGWGDLWHIWGDYSVV